MSSDGVRPHEAVPTAGGARLLAEAARLIAERGASQMSLADLGQRTGLSTGGIYHHFPAGKEGIAAAVYVEALRRYQGGLLTVLESAVEARAAIQGTVAYHLRWVERNPDWARVLASQRDAALRLASERAARELNAAFAEAALAALEPFFASGELRRLPFDVLAALVIGPCQEFGRHMLAGNTQTAPAQATKLLATQTWNAVAGS